CVEKRVVVTKRPQQPRHSVLANFQRERCDQEHADGRHQTTEHRPNGVLEWRPNLRVVIRHGWNHSAPYTARSTSSLAAARVPNIHTSCSSVIRCASASTAPLPQGR